MKLFVSSKNRLMLIGFIVGLMLIGNEIANADFIFGKPKNLGPIVSSPFSEGAMNISTDGLTLYFSSGRPGGIGMGGMSGQDIWMTTRPTLSEPWGAPMNLGPPINSTASESFPSISEDGLTLYFCDFFYGSARSGGMGGKDLWMSRRASKDALWDEPVNLGPVVNSTADDVTPTTSADGLTLIFASNRGSSGWQYDLWMSTRPSTDSEWEEPVNMGPEVNSSAYDGAANLSSNGLLLFFTSTRSGGLGQDDIWLTVRKTINDPWEPSVNLGDAINTSVVDAAPEISADGRMLYFDSPRAGTFGNYDLWQVPIEPVIDLNGDANVDVKDIVIITEHWGENYPLCDIGPTPLGDGIVDIQDLVVLTEYIEPIDQTLIAHWALDKTEGDIAQDSAGDNDAFVTGDPVWLPSGGQVDGAIMLDGLDDSLVTGPVPNLAKRPFSVFAWIIGVTPGQVVLSQIGGVNWLCTDPSEGNLVTELKGPGRGAATLLSQAVITDGNWHRIGLVWDGSSRMLYVDGVAVAQDTQDALIGSDSGLYIGCGKAMEPGTYWSGLIDDVRIYNRVVRP